MYLPLCPNQFLPGVSPSVFSPLARSCHRDASPEDISLSDGHSVFKVHP